MEIMNLKLEEMNEYFAGLENIIGVWIIGSYGTDNQRKESDLDIAILFDKEVTLYDEMKLSAVISSIIAFEAVDIINLKKAPITLQFKTISEGRQIYESDYFKVCDYIEFVNSQYHDARFYIEKYNRDYILSFKLVKKPGTHT
jgi:predicted nucleotidyltransferase